MEGGFSTQVILAKAQAIVEGSNSPDVGIVIDLPQTKESIQASMIPVALQEHPGLYMYRFQVPIGDIYRFRLSTRLSPLTKSTQSTILSTRFIDYAISRAAAEDGICANHFQPFTNGNELHLGEADYLALLAHGQCACTSTITTTNNNHKVDGCYKCPFDESRGREVGDAPANTGLGATIGLDRHGKMILCEDLAWPEQRGWASGELPQKTLDEPEVSYPEPDVPATGLDLFLAVDNSAGTRRRTADDKDDFHEEAKWNGVCASGEDGDCRQQRLYEQEISVLLQPGDKEVEEELERGLLLSHRSLTTGKNDSVELNTRFRLGSSDVGTGSGLAPAGDEPSSPALRPGSVLASVGDEPWAIAFHLDSDLAPPGNDPPSSPAVLPDSVLASAGDEPWAIAFHLDSDRAPAGNDPPSSPAVLPDSVLASAKDESWHFAVEAKDVARETYVFERCQRNCVHASDKENILFAVFDDSHTFLFPQLNDSFRQSLCSATVPLPSDVVRDLLYVVSGSKFFRLLEGSDSEPRHSFDGLDSQPLLLSSFENHDPVLRADVESAMQPHGSKDRKQSSHTSMRQTLTSEDSEAASGSSASSATRVTAVETEADIIIDLSEEDVETRCGVAESYHVNFKVRLRFWGRARQAVIRAFHRIRDFFRGLFQGWGRAPQPTSNRRGRLSHPSETSDEERVECGDMSKA